MVCGCSIIVKSPLALKLHSLIGSLFQEMTMTEFDDLIYTIGKASKEHSNDSIPELGKLHIDIDVNQYVIS
jgi:hypothetical protein